MFFFGVSIQKRLRRRYFRRVINVLIWLNIWILDIWIYIVLYSTTVNELIKCHMRERRVRNSRESEQETMLTQCLRCQWIFWHVRGHIIFKHYEIKFLLYFIIIFFSFSKVNNFSWSKTAWTPLKRSHLD